MRSTTELAATDWAVERGVFAGPSVAVPAALFRASGSDASLTGPAPGLGEHNADVLADWLDLDPPAVAALEAAGTVARPDPPPWQPVLPR